MYTDRNFKTKKALKEAVTNGETELGEIVMAKELVTTNQTMAERFLALKEKIAHDTTQSAAVIRADLDSRMLAHIHYRASELIDLVLG